MHDLPRKIAGLVINPGSGSARSAQELQEMIADLVDLRMYEVGPDNSPEACAKKALAEGAHYVIAGGGDGTVSGVAAALVNSSIPLGILPLGTANSIARALDIPNNVEDAIRFLREVFQSDLPPRHIDTAVANGRMLVLHASVGLHASAVGEAPPEAKKQWGPLAYLVTAIRKLQDQPQFTAHLTIDEERIECRAINITIANFAPRETVSAQGPAVLLPDDGWLDVTIVAADALPSVLATGMHLLRTAFAGTPAERDDIGYVVVKRIRIDSDPPQPILIDGEEVGTTPIEVFSRPKSLFVLAPPGQYVEKPVDWKLHGLPGLKVESAHDSQE